MKRGTAICCESPLHSQHFHSLWENSSVAVQEECINQKELLSFSAPFFKHCVSMKAFTIKTTVDTQVSRSRSEATAAIESCTKK